MLNVGAYLSSSCVSLNFWCVSFWFASRPCNFKLNKHYLHRANVGGMSPVHKAASLSSELELKAEFTEASRERQPPCIRNRGRIPSRTCTDFRPALASFRPALAISLFCIARCVILFACVNCYFFTNIWNIFLQKVILFLCPFLTTTFFNFANSSLDDSSIFNLMF